MALIAVSNSPIIVPHSANSTDAECPWQFALLCIALLVHIPLLWQSAPTGLRSCLFPKGDHLVTRSSSPEQRIHHLLPLWQHVPTQLVPEACLSCKKCQP